MELTVETGKGYIPAGQNKQEESIGLIPIDAVFSPSEKWLIKLIMLGSVK